MSLIEWNASKGNPILLPPMWKHTPQPSLQERDRRWAAIRRKMKEQNFDCMMIFGSDIMFGLAHANFRYVTALPTLGQSVCIFPAEGEPVAYVGTPHNHYYKAAYRWVEDVRPAASGEHAPAVMDMIQTVKDMGCEGGRIAIPAPLNNAGGKNDSLMYQQWTSIKEGLPKAEFVENVRILDELKTIKSPEEIQLLEESARLSTLAYKALIDSARPGVRECEVHANMRQAIIAGGGDINTMMLLDSGNPPMGHPKDPPPSMRKLELGDTIITEYHTGYAGYQTGTQYSVTVGPHSAERDELFELIKRAYRAELEVMKPGHTFRESVAAARDIVDASDMDWMECGSHLHGLGSGEWRGNMSVTSHAEAHELNADFPVMEGMCVCCANTFFNPKHLEYGGITFGFTHIITADGNRQLEDIPWEFPAII